MRFILSFFLIVLFISPSAGQTKKRGKVKRKFRNTEQSSPQLQEVFMRGVVYDWNNVSVPGATVSIDGTAKGVHTNFKGEFYIGGLNTGKARVRISHIGMQTKTVDYILRPGENYYKIMLREEHIHLPQVTVSSQKREQHLLDVPEAITALSSERMDQTNLTELVPLSDHVPGLWIREQGANRPGFIIRGLTSDEVSPSAQPRISVYMNDVPISRASAASVELFDMKRVEVVKGPQNTLFGRGAQAGAVHFISKKPVNYLHGYASAGTGLFNQLEAKGAVNVPVIEDKLFIRAAGIYSEQDGFVKNTFGGTLNGKKTKAGRVSVRFLPGYRHRIDLVANYHKDTAPGIAFMSKMFPNTNGDIDIFGGTASLEQGKQLGTDMFYYDAQINYSFYIREHTYLSSISSYRNSLGAARWDGDGSAAAAIDMWERSPAEQFYQELRLNFARESRFNGSLGASYWKEKAEQTYGLFTDERQMAFLFFSPESLVLPNGQPNMIDYFPLMGPMPLPKLRDSHVEQSDSKANNKAVEAFLDGTYQLTRKIFITVGVRGVYDMFTLWNENSHIGGAPSTLGFLTQNYPNVFFRTGPAQEISEKTFSLTGRAGIQYKFNDYGNAFVNLSRGRRPKVLQFTATGEKEVLNAEILDNLEGGFKATLFERIYFDAVGFYQKYKNFQTRSWVADPGTGEFNYKVKDGGRATSYGAEVSLEVAITEKMGLFGNYAYLHATFDSTDVDGKQQAYAGNTFRLSPEHTFTAGFNVKTEIMNGISVFFTPSYSFRTHHFFEDENTEGLEQDAYGVLNINGGIELSSPNVILSVWGTNLLEEEYITSAGNTGSLFGVPTFVPGPPRMYGAKLMWKFSELGSIKGRSRKRLRL